MPFFDERGGSFLISLEKDRITKAPSYQNDNISYIYFDESCEQLVVRGDNEKAEKIQELLGGHDAVLAGNMAFEALARAIKLYQITIIIIILTAIIMIISMYLLLKK